MEDSEQFNIIIHNIYNYIVIIYVYSITYLSTERVGFIISIVVILLLRSHTPGLYYIHHITYRYLYILSNCWRTKSNIFYCIEFCERPPEICCSSTPPETTTNCHGNPKWRSCPTRTHTHTHICMYIYIYTDIFYKSATVTPMRGLRKIVYLYIYKAPAISQRGRT